MSLALRENPKQTCECYQILLHAMNVLLLFYLCCIFDIVSNNSHVNTEQKGVFCSCPRMNTLKKMAAANVLPVKFWNLVIFFTLGIKAGPLELSFWSF